MILCNLPSTLTRALNFSISPWRRSKSKKMCLDSLVMGRVPSNLQRGSSSSVAFNKRPHASHWSPRASYTSMLAFFFSSSKKHFLLHCTCSWDKHLRHNDQPRIYRCINNYPYWCSNDVYAYLWHFSQKSWVMTASLVKPFACTLLKMSWAISVCSSVVVRPKWSNDNWNHL